MLRDYHRQTTIKPFAPILRDRTLKQWDSNISIRTNLSLLSISKSSKSSDDEVINQPSNDRDSSSSRESSSPLLNESEEHRKTHTDLDPYILRKHLNGIPSTNSSLVENDIDRAVKNLCDESKSSFHWQNDDYDPRLIRPPPFSQYIRQVKESRAKIKPIQRRSARILVRTTKAEQLKLSRQQSANENMQNLPKIRPSTTIGQHRIPVNSQMRHTAIPAMNRMTRSRTDSGNGFRQSESARSFPSYSKPLNSALLREQPHPLLNHQYKMKQIHHWLEKLIPTDYIEYNEYASTETIFETNFNDILDDENDLLSDEKCGDNIERTYAEAHRALPLFKSEINQKMRQHNLLLTRIELDLYVI